MANIDVFLSIWNEWKNNWKVDIDISYLNKKRYQTSTSKDHYSTISRIKQIIVLVTLISFIFSYPIRAMIPEENENYRSSSSSSARQELTIAINSSDFPVPSPFSARKERPRFKRINPSNQEQLPDSQETLLVIQHRGTDPTQPWLETCIFGEGVSFNNCKKNTMLAIEVFSGSARGAVYFELGYDLAMRLKAPWRTILRYPYGFCVFLPMAVLGTRSSSRVFKKLVTGKPQAEQDIERRHSFREGVENYTIKSLALTAGLLSAPPLTYLAYSEFHNSLGWGWIVPGIPTYYVRTLIDYDATTELAERLRLLIKVRKDRIHANYDSMGRALNREALLTNIRDKFLNPARTFIQSFDFEQAERFSEEMEQQLNALEKTKLLFHPKSVILENEVNLQTDHIVKKIVSVIGGIIGIYGTWIFFPLAEKSWAPIVGSDESWQAVFAVISLVSVSPVTFISSESSTGKFCSAMWNLGSSICTAFSSRRGADGEDERAISEEVRIRKEKARNREISLKNKRIGAAIFSTFLAGCFALTQAEIAMEFFDINKTGVKINLLAQIMATFSLVFWAVDELLLDYLKAGDPRTPHLNKIDTINKKIDDMTDDNLRRLESHLQSPDQVSEAENVEEGDEGDVPWNTAEKRPLLNSLKPIRDFGSNVSAE